MRDQSVNYHVAARAVDIAPFGRATSIEGMALGKLELRMIGDHRRIKVASRFEQGAFGRIKDRITISRQPGVKRPVQVASFNDRLPDRGGRRNRDQFVNAVGYRRSVKLWRPEIDR